jgi:hypothetical protein
MKGLEMLQVLESDSSRYIFQSRNGMGNWVWYGEPTPQLKALVRGFQPWSTNLDFLRLWFDLEKVRAKFIELATLKKIEPIEACKASLDVNK